MRTDPDMFLDDRLRVTLARALRATLAQALRVTLAQAFRVTLAQAFRATLAQAFRATLAQAFRVTLAQAFRVTLAQALRATLALTALGLPVMAQAATATAKNVGEPTATQHPFLWRIEARGEQAFATPSWIHGTMPLGDRRLITLPAAVNDAREAATAVYCELDLQQMARRQADLGRAMLLPDGQQLRDRLPKELYARLARYVDQHGASMEDFDRLQVWAVNLRLQTLDRGKAEFSHSLDQLLLDDAHKAGKQVGGLETIDEQIAAISAAPRSDQIEVLRDAIAQGEEHDRKGVIPMVELLEVYLRGDEHELLTKYHESTQRNKDLFARVTQPLLARRNGRMAERIDAMLREHPGRCHFYAIGALHLLGEGGVLQRLRQKGYRITRLQPPPSMVAVLEQRIAELLAVVIRQAKANALLDARVRSLEFKVQVLERRLR